MSLDHIAIERRLAGDTSVTLNDDETTAAVRILTERGETVATIIRTTGAGERVVMRIRREMKARERAAA